MYEVKPVPPDVVASVPVTPVERGSPVALVSVTDVGVPRIGVTSVGLVAKTIDPEPVTVLPKAVTVPLVGSVKDVFPDVVKAVV